ncbi:hypothetical protein [Lentzea sp. NPDC003310]|uniref:HEAT repeat domain-containing protein n=1 Tax=Lentzea sp. NPDC003310 TaxID=3154447 RepID=UPI0033BE6475
MLNGLDEIDWAALEHAYGAAEDVPDQLRALVSADDTERSDALGELFGNIYHQGTIYEATAYAVPFLLEALTAPECEEQPHLLFLLASIVVGYDEMWLPGGLPIAEHRATAANEPADEDYAKNWVRAYDAVRAGVPLFRALLTSEPQVRCLAAYALAWFPEEAADSLRALAPITADPDEAVAATASVAMGLLGGRPAFDDTRPLARWGAAVALGTVDGPAAADEVVDELIAATSLPDSDQVPFLEGNLAALAGSVLRLTGDRHTARTLTALLDRIPALSGTSAFHVVKEALHLAFPSGAAPEDLDDAQRRLVDVLVASPGAWLINGNRFGNFSMLVREYGLPDSHEAMRAYTSTR